MNNPGSTATGKAIAANIAKYMQLRGITQVQLAYAMGINPSGVNHYIRGRREPMGENLSRLADALGVTTDELLGRTTAATVPAAVAEVWNTLTDRDRRTAMIMMRTMAPGPKITSVVYSKPVDYKIEILGVSK